MNSDAQWIKAACKQLFKRNLRCKQIRKPYHRCLSIWASVLGKELLTGLRLVCSPFTKQTEELDRYVTNVIREGYHPLSCAFNETPLTMWPWSVSTISLLSNPTASQPTLRAQCAPDMGYIWYHPTSLNFKIWIHSGAGRKISRIANRSRFLSVTIQHVILARFHLPTGLQVAWAGHISLK